MPAPEDRLATPLEIGVTFVLFAAIAFGLNYAGLAAPAIYDDGILTDNVHFFVRHDPLGIIRLMPQRPLTQLSFYVNYLITGLSPYAFRVVNTAILAAAGVALVLLLRIIFLLRETALPGSALDKRGVSLFLGLLFVVHPLQSQVVLYSWQRSAILGCFFCYATLAAYLAVRSGRRKEGLSSYGLVSLLLLLGMLSKENNVILPLVLAVAELALFPGQSIGQLFRRGIVVALVVVPPLVIYSLLAHLFYGQGSMELEGALARIRLNYALSGLSVSEVAMTECRILFHYLAMILAPFIQTPHLIEVTTISSSLWEPPSTAAACAGVVTLLGSSVALARRQPLIAFGILFSVISLAPEMFLVPQYLFFGYRAILPMAGVLLIVGLAVLGLLTRPEQALPRRALSPTRTFIGLLILIPFGAVTVSQSFRWDPITFWRDNYLRLPRHSPRVEKLLSMHVLVNYGVVLMQKGDESQAVELFNRALKIGDGPEVRLSLAEVQVKQGIFHEALEHSRKAVQLDPNSRQARLQLGVVQSKLGDLSAAMESYRKALDLDPNCVQAFLNMADVEMRQGRPAEAEKYYRKAILIDPSHAGAHTGLGNFLLGRGQAEEALQQYRIAAAGHPDSAELHLNMGAALLRLNRAVEAKEHFEAAVALKPGNVKAHANLGIALSALGDNVAAIKHLSRALEIQPDLLVARIQLGHVFWKAGDIGRAAQEYATAAQSYPNSAEAHFYLARAREALSDRTAAIAEYRKVLELDPQNASAHASLGSLLISSGDPAAAVDHLRKALELRPDLAKARKDLDEALSRKGSPSGRP